MIDCMESFLCAFQFWLVHIESAKIKITTEIVKVLKLVLC